MRLLYSAGFPFARLVRIALLETGLDALVTKHELRRTRLYSPESDVLALNPVGRVPTLELDDGTILTESKLILDYIEAPIRGRSCCRTMVRTGGGRWRRWARPPGPAGRYRDLDPCAGVAGTATCRDCGRA